MGNRVKRTSRGTGVAKQARARVMDGLNARAGRTRWGYVEPTEAASELLSGEEFHWRSGRNFLRLGPGQSHILRVETR